MNKQFYRQHDKFYTKPETAHEIVSCYISLLSQEGVDLTKVVFIEPSAGDGVFVTLLQELGYTVLGFDIAPTGSNVTQCDFLSEEFTPGEGSQPLIFIGNPPFGTKGVLAIQFINKCLSFSGYVGFILPLQFRKWSAHKHIEGSAKLIFDEKLPEDAFTFMGDNYNLRCSFQVWSMTSSSTDLRVKGKPVTQHPDFEMYQFNRTTIAEKYFDQKTYGWDFAIPRQGFYNYTYFFFTEEEIAQADPTHKRQWIFFKASTPTILCRLLDMDFTILSQKNSRIPGFGKADVVEFYRSLYT